MKSSPIPLWLAIFLVLIALAYTGFFLSLTNAPFLDAPDHLARAVIMKSLWFDANSPFQGTFTATHFFMPYMLPDLGLIGLLKLLGVQVAYPVWSTLTMLALTFAIWIYARQLLTTSWAIAAATLCGWFFATNYFYILGFFAFQWGLAASFIALGAVEALRRGKSRLWIAIYVLACFVAYGTHMACFAILGALIGAIGFVRVRLNEQSWLQLIGELLPFTILAAYHLLLVPAHPEAIRGFITHSTVLFKTARFFASMFLRQSYVLDGALIVLFLGIIVTALRGAQIDFTRRWPLPLICGLSFLGYLALPIGWGAGYYIDMRFLPYFFIPLFLFALGEMELTKPDRGRIRLLMIACSLLAVANLASLATFLPKQNREVGQYREALDSIPAGQIVFPIDTRRADGRSRPMLHAASLYEVDRAGYTPYVPSANRGGPAGYFSDLSQLYRPDQNWFVNHQAPDWAKILATYDYVVITKPWQPQSFDLIHLQPHFENTAAVVFRVQR